MGGALCWVGCLGARTHARTGVLDDHQQLANTWCAASRDEAAGSDNVLLNDTSHGMESTNDQCSLQPSHDKSPLMMEQERDEMDSEMSNRLVIDTGEDNDVVTQDEPEKDTLVPTIDTPLVNGNSPMPSPAIETDCHALSPSAVAEALELSINGRAGDSSASSDSGSGGMTSLESGGHASNSQLVNSGASSPSSARNSVSKSRRRSDRILPLSCDNGLETFVCPVCGEILPSNHDLTKHIRSHNNTSAAVSPTTNTCTICHKVLSSQSSLDRHMLVHSGERPFECSLCKTAFTTNGNMHRHMRIHDKEFAMSNNSENIDGSFSPLGSSSQNRTPRTKKRSDLSADESSECGLPFTPASKRKAFSHDFPSTHNSAAKRIMFDGDFGGSSAEERNSRVDVVDMSCEEASDGPGLMCPICRYKFITTYGLSCHLETYHSSHSKASLDFPCLYCKTKLHGLEKLTSHMWLVHHRNSMTSDSQFVDGSISDDVFASPEVSRKISTSNKGTSSSSGFYASLSEVLPIVDFSCEKFSLVKQLLSDRSPVRKLNKSSIQSTPTRTPVANHDVKKLTYPCLNCEQSFISRAQCSEHAVQYHDTSMIMAEFSSHSVNCDPRQEDVSKDEFALVLGLKVAADRSTVLALPSPTDSSVDKSAVVDANRNVIKVETSPQSVPNGQSTSVLFGHLVALASSVSQILPCSLPGVLNLPQQISLISAAKPMHQAFNVTPSVTFESPVLVADPRNSRPFAGMVTPSVSSLVATPSMPSVPYLGLLRQFDNSVAMEQSDTAITMDESSPNDSDGTDMKADTSDKDSTNNAGSYRCSVCDDSFISYRAYRGHMVSVHLGTSPYKCTQCAYASPDRSTLIRHLRTHNGERPFQCLICEFAFTTKANCERHVRKKHGLESKQDMEQSIGYSRCSKELPQAADVDVGLPLTDPATSSTVCKFCGEDFKFYRTLKHHLRSQSSCAHKPFTCRSCSVGFSTKANCIRHIQKRHLPLAAGVTTESLMTVNETLLAAQQGNQNVRPASQCSNFTTTSETKQAQQQSSHSENLAGANARLDSSKVPSHYNIMHTIKREDVPSSNVYDDQPLDFSLKSATASVMLPLPLITSTPAALYDNNDMPMDLSTGARSKHVSSVNHSPSSASVAKVTNNALISPLSLVVASKSTTDTLPSSLLAAVIPSTVVTSQLRRPVSGTTRGSSITAQSWQCPYCCTLFKNSFKLMVHMRTHVTEALHRCSHCDAEFKMKTNLEWHIKTTHPQFADTNNNSSHETSQHPTASEEKDCNDNSDKNLDIEQNNNVPGAINANLYSKVDVNLRQQTDPVTSKAMIESQKDTNLSSMNSLLDVTSKRQLSGLAQPEVLNITTSEIQSKVSVPSTEPKTNELADTDIRLKSVADLGCDMGDSSVRRKRNSYADSPHKLRCPYCPRAFPWISSLKRHILTHTGQKPFRCPQCPVTFSTKSNRERHMIRKHGLDVHDPATRQMMDRPYKCHLCIFSSFATSGKLIRHYKTKHSDRDLPDGLLASMPNMSQEELTAALNQLAAESGMSENSGGAMNLTNEQGDSDDAQNYDMDDSDEDDDDSLNNDSLERAAEAVVDAVVRTIVRVPSSSTAVASPSLIDNLPNIAIQNRSDGLSSAVMDGQGQVSLRAAGINPERDNYNVDRITECWQCNRTFDCRKSLLRHLKEHGVDLPFKCYLCDASFGSRVSSLTHKSVAHGTDWAMLRDKNRVGTDIADFSDFVDRVVEEALAGGTVTPVTARRTRDGVELDIRLESDYAQRKVFCSLCPKRFWSLQDLRRHMRSHTGERPFECDVCHARFTLKHSMMRHRRKHEGSGMDVGDIHSDSDEESLVDGTGGRNVMADNLPRETSYSQIALPDLIQSMPLASSAGTSSKVTTISSVASAVSSSLPAADDGPSDLLQNLLGVSDAATIEHMLDSAVGAATSRLVASNLLQPQVELNADRTL